MGIKRVRLNYHYVAERISNEIAYVVSFDHVNAVNRSIDAKCKRNAMERQETYTDLKTDNPVFKKKM